MDDDERDYYLPCGCWSGQADHTRQDRYDNEGEEQ
jgi:hypothetical protein